MKTFKRFFHSYKEREYNDNTLLAYKKLLNGTMEVIYWAEHFEVYYRPTKKRYGYFLKKFEELDRAINLMNQLPEEKALEIALKSGNYTDIFTITTKKGG